MTPAVPRRIALRPLTAEAFAPFGRVTDVDSGERRNRITDAFERTEEATEPRLWISTAQQASVLPLKVTSLERHPFSTQTFVPLQGAGYLVAVCHALADGQPDLDTLQAFEAGPGQAVTYARNVWHHGLSVLQVPACFVACMSFTTTGGDDIFVPVEAHIELVAATDESQGHA